MEKSFKSVIDQANSLLILLPNDPSFDQVAGALSLYLALEGKKDVIVSCPTEMRVEYNRLVGINKITDEVGSKNLVLKFSDYPAENIERVSYDVENSEFRLSVVPKPQAEPPKKEQVKISYSGVSADTVILIGGEKAGDFPALSAGELNESKLIHIGINDISVPSDRKVISLSRPASAVSELMADYVKELENGFHPDIASNLLSGIHEGSNNFAGKNVSAHTFKLAGDLMSAGGKYTKKEEFKPRPNFNFPQSMMGIQNPPLPVPFPMPPKAQKGSAKLDDESPEEDANETPEGETVNPPASWLKNPKIYKGTSVS